MNVASILKSKGRAVSTIRPNATLSDVTKKLAPKRIGAIVVVGENGQVTGIISERDIIRAISQAWRPGPEHDGVGGHDAHRGRVSEGPASSTSSWRR